MEVAKFFYFGDLSWCSIPFNPGAPLSGVGCSIMCMYDITRLHGMVYLGVGKHLFAFCLFDKVMWQALVCVGVGPYFNVAGSSTNVTNQKKT